MKDRWVMARWRKLERVDELAHHARTFLVDQFGTLHDGQRAYPGAPEALARLRASGARIALLSNSGTRAEPNIARLERLGFAPDSYDACVTSGEVAWNILARETHAEAAAVQRTVFLIARGTNRFLQGLPLIRTDDPDRADLLVIAGSEADTLGLDHYRTLLGPLAARRVPCLCTNPDHVMVLGADTAPGSGVLAAIYAEMGGAVRWIGKPHPPIYRAALEALGATAGTDVIGIGDSLEHDIAGAIAVGCRSAFVTTGIAAGMTPEALDEEASRLGVSPSFVLPAFR